MRIVLFCDMEGVCGIQSWEHVGGNTPLYDEGRRLYTAEVNAAVRGCLAGGATYVVAQDGHGGAYSGCKAFMNWIPDQLEPGGEYVRGYRWGCFFETLERGECDAIGFVGAHAKAGAEDGVLAHTISADGWHSVSINGVEVGESSILAALAGTYGVPAICVAGDFAACEELEHFLGGPIVKVPIKWGLNRYGARMLAPADACRRIEEGFRTAISSRDEWPSPVSLGEPVTVTVELASPDRAAALASQRGVERAGPRTVEVRGRTVREAWSKLWLAV